MSTKKPALSTQLKNANARIAELEKKVADEKARGDMYYNNANKLTAEIDNVHAFLDAVPNSMPRQNEQSYQQYSVMTRLAAWLSVR